MAEVQYSFTDPLLGIYFLDPAKKKDKEEGKKIAKAFYTQQTSSESSLNYFRGRNAKWIELLLWAKGSQPMQEFLDYMSVSDANKSYVNMDMTQQRLAPQVLNTIIETLSKNILYPCVNAVDNGSINEKEQRKRDALYRMYDQENIAKFQQAGGVPVEPVGAFVPRDELSANMYFEIEDRLPKEIRFEKMLQKVFTDIKFDRIINRKGIFDEMVLNFEAVKIEKIADGTYMPRKCIPTNMVYNFFINDSGEYEITTIGEFRNIKVKDFRRLYGKSKDNPDGMTEKDIYELAKQSTIRSNGTFNFQWNTQWNANTVFYSRPYDDYSVYVLDFEKDCGEDIYFVEKTDNFGNIDVQQKSNVPYQQKKKNGETINQPIPDNVTITKKGKNTWMHGVYAPYNDKMLYWGEPDLIISPYDNVYKCLSSYSVNIPNNDGEYVPSLFERIMEPLREYTITKLKRKLLITQIEPDGFRVDVESSRNLDLGAGNTIPWEEVVRIKRQTGVELWSSKGVNPLEQTPPPITAGVHSTIIDKIIGLTNIIGGILQEIRMLIGSSVYLEGGDLPDRTAATLAENQTENASNVFGYPYNAHLQVWEEVCYKLTCLHWNDVVKTSPESENDLINSRFDCGIKIKSTDYERQQLEKSIDIWSKTLDGDGQPLLTPKDVLVIRNLDNYKSQTVYLANAIEEKYKKAQADKARAEQANIQSQQQSLQMKGQIDAQMQQEKLVFEKQLQQILSRNKKEEIFLEGYMNLWATVAKTPGSVMPKEVEAIAPIFLQNVSMPAAVENKEMREAIISDAQQQMQQEQMEQQQGTQEPQGQEMPQEQMEQQPAMQPQMQPQQ